MKPRRKPRIVIIYTIYVLSLSLFLFGLEVHATNMAQLKQRGELRHLGVPYANFISGDGDGMDVELIKEFCQSIGVEYKFILSDWGTLIPDLIGRAVINPGDQASLGNSTPIRGDLIASGFTVLEWRTKLIRFSAPTFPSQIWLLARADSKITPIKPSKDVHKDITNTKEKLKGNSVISMKMTCLDPTLYGLKESEVKIHYTKGKLNDMVPAVLKNEAETTLVDVPEALIALEKWPGKLKIVGPISEKQFMATAFATDSSELLEEFNNFLAKAKQDGRYLKIVKKYYPSASRYFPEFFQDMKL